MVGAEGDIILQFRHSDSIIFSFKTFISYLPSINPALNIFCQSKLKNLFQSILTQKKHCYCYNSTGNRFQNEDLKNELFVDNLYTTRIIARFKEECKSEVTHVIFCILLGANILCDFETYFVTQGYF